MYINKIWTRLKQKVGRDKIEKNKEKLNVKTQSIDW